MEVTKTKFASLILATWSAKAPFDKCLGVPVMCFVKLESTLSLSLSLSLSLWCLVYFQHGISSLILILWSNAKGSMNYIGILYMFDIFIPTCFLLKSL